MFSLLLGATMIEKAMRDIEDASNQEGREVEERTQFGTQKFTSKQFRRYTLQKIKKGFTDPIMAVNEDEYM